MIPKELQARIDELASKAEDESVKKYMDGGGGPYCLYRNAHKAGAAGMYAELEPKLREVRELLLSIELDGPDKLKVWGCKIGEVANKKLPQGSDSPMRNAIRDAYIKITGEEPDFIFSGWGEELTEGEREAHNNTSEVLTGDAVSEQEKMKLWILLLEQEVEALRSVLAEVDGDQKEYLQMNKADNLEAVRLSLVRPHI